MTVIFDEWLEIDGVDLANHAYWIESLAPLFNIQKRGSDRVLPNLAGARPYRRRIASLSVSLTVNVLGDVDEDNTPNADPRTGLYDNLRYLEDNLLADVESTQGTRLAVWHLPDGSTRSAEVQVEAFTVVGNTPISAQCSLELTIVDGHWDAAAGS
jgi:hypothetical protein